jgi:predicted dehydrogenase
VLGCGFWSRFQIPAWLELPGVECVAVCDIDPDKAKAVAGRFGVSKWFQNPEELLQQIRPDLVDIITSPETHRELVGLAARYRVPVICQKPMANDLETARQMVRICETAGVPFSIHENWRWQLPLREVKRALDSDRIGAAFRARIDFNSSFPVFDNQPFLRELEQFILSDVGTHVLDVVRFLFGESEWLVCQTHRVNKTIRGEDVATVLLQMKNGMSVTCTLSYASRLEFERFPETFLLIEGDKGSIELAPDFWVRITDDKATNSRRCPPPVYSWADPNYGLIHASIVECHRNLLGGIQGTAPAETTGADNLRTLQLVYGSYESARLGRIVKIP